MDPKRLQALCRRNGAAMRVLAVFSRQPRPLTTAMRTLVEATGRPDAEVRQIVRDLFALGVLEKRPARRPGTTKMAGTGYGHTVPRSRLVAAFKRAAKAARKEWAQQQIEATRRLQVDLFASGEDEARA